MQLLGENVKHERFGVGQIIDVQPKRITVSFQAPYGEKRFIYPDAFETYLMAQDTQICIELKRALEERSEQLAAQERALHERLAEQSKRAAEEKAQERSGRARARRTTAKTK